MTSGYTVVRLRVPEGIKEELARRISERAQGPGSDHSEGAGMTRPPGVMTQLGRERCQASGSPPAAGALRMHSPARMAGR
jgi:hypothetical protein